MKESLPIFPTVYFPSIEYLYHLLQFEKIQIDQHENYQKQTLRNRCYILSPNGIQCLIVPVKHTGEKMLVKDVKISYDEGWQQQHWRSLEAAYNRSAFFEFYKDELNIILFKKQEFLFDLNEAIFLWVLQKLKSTTISSRSEIYLEEKSFQFLSNKKNTEVSSPINLKSYPQVFSSKFGFTKNLSGIDLLFNTGNTARDYLS